MEILVIVTSAADPEFSPGLVDRVLVAAQMQGILPIICVNKIDLLASPVKPWAIYSELGFEVFEVSATRGTGIPALRDRLLKKRVAFFGHSGVGKTSLLRALIGEQIGKVGEVSEVTGKGKHTTTGAVLIQGPEDSLWIDTPGVREFGLIGLNAEQLAEYFPEFRGLDPSDPESPARELPRYESYCRIRDSLLEELEE